MHSVHKRLTANKIISLGLTFALICPPLSGFLTPASAQQPATSVSALGVRSVLVFPTANDTASTTAAASDTAMVPMKLDAALKFRFDTVGKIKITYFDRHLASVQRALDDKVLVADDITPPFADSTKASKVAAQVSSDAYLIESIESYNWDATARKAVIEVSADLYNTTTGDHLKTLAFTGRGTAFSNSDSQTTVTQYAINDAASQIVSSLNSDVVSHTPEKVTNSQIGKASPVPTLVAVVLGGALLYAIFHHNNSNSNSSTTTTTTGTGTGTGTGTTSGTGSGTPPSPPSL